MTLSAPHRPHPRDGEPEAVLYDDCPRCAEHANHPFTSLDDDHIRRLLLRVEYRTGAEARAGRQVRRALSRLSRIEVQPKADPLREAVT